MHDRFASILLGKVFLAYLLEEGFFDLIATSNKLLMMANKMLHSMLTYLEHTTNFLTVFSDKSGRTSLKMALPHDGTLIKYFLALKAVT